MTKFYQKSEVWFAIFWIVIYVVGTSLADELSAKLGIEKVLTFVFLLIISIVFLTWIFKNKLSQKYGLCKPAYSAKNFLFFLPLLVLISINFWFGIELNLTVLESVLYVLTMLCVGFVEEIIFRGFLFKAMEKDSLKPAIIVSSITFGIGHIVNLLNSSQETLVSNICQVCYAIAIGFLFVIIFYRGKSLLPCIITHSLFNAGSLFLNNAAMSGLTEILVSVGIVVFAVVYTLILLKTLPKKEENNKEQVLKEDKKA
ncbi:MAG: CPBP family intramembrane metalloprotease [Clostridia bacterium]|nr:CPBP family intramembrane metalloprotease [Clostridia bacterium]